MTKDELLGKELSNLYAIAKQVNSYFNDSDISFLSEGAQRSLVNYVKFSSKNEEQVARALRNLEINPGNTTDSIVQEMTENLRVITNQKGLDTEVRELGFTLSLSRLISYHLANINNLDYRGRKI